MISRRHRFHGSNAVQSVYRTGQSFRGPSIGLKVSHRAADRPYRVAVVVSKKVSKSAVVRNRIRRRVYEAVRTAELPVTNGTDLVFTVFGEQFATMDSPQLRTIVHNLLKTVP